MDTEQIAWLALVVMGLVAGVGMLAVRSSAAEATHISAVFPIARLFQYRGFRVAVSLAGFAFAIVGAVGLTGKLG